MTEQERINQIKMINEVLNKDNPAWKEEIDWLIFLAEKTLENKEK